MTASGRIALPRRATIVKKPIWWRWKTRWRKGPLSCSPKASSCITKKISPNRLLLEVITPTEVRLTISEGRYHQVKRMFAAVGNHVVGLHRERIGDILLDESLAPGEYRPLTEAEIASVGAPQPRSKT